MTPMRLPPHTLALVDATIDSAAKTAETIGKLGATAVTILSFLTIIGLVARKMLRLDREFVALEASYIAIAKAQSDASAAVIEQWETRLNEERDQKEFWKARAMHNQQLVERTTAVAGGAVSVAGQVVERGGAA